jgi:hypothetical protein
MSWAEVLTVAVQQRVHRGVSDPDQAWILGELIRYLEHPKSGALDFTDMGSSWVTVREAIAAGTLRTNDRGLPEVISRWEQLLRFAALRLGRELGADVQVLVSRREAADPAVRFAAQTTSLVSAGMLSGTLRIPDAVAPIDVAADLRANRITVSIDVDAPREGRAATRVSWLTRQLRDAPDGLRLDAFTAGLRNSTSDLLRQVREDPTVLIADSKREFRTFRVAATSPLGTKRGVGRGGFIDSVLAALDGFYGTVVQQIRPWTAKAPQLPRASKTAVEEAGIDIEPPIRDLREVEDEPDAARMSPPPSDEPAAVVYGVRAGEEHSGDGAPQVESPREPMDDQATAELPPTGGEAAGAKDDAELVSWEVERERLDHARNLDDAANPVEK